MSAKIPTNLTSTGHGQVYDVRDWLLLMFGERTYLWRVDNAHTQTTKGADGVKGPKTFGPFWSLEVEKLEEQVR